MIINFLEKLTYALMWISGDIALISLVLMILWTTKQFKDVLDIMAMEEKVK